MSVEVRTLLGDEFEAAIPVLAQLRITVFRDWPYLYEGDLEYEARYLERFRDAERAFLAAAFDGDRIIGATTAAPLSGEEPEFRLPFLKAGYDISSIFYFAESILLPEYRGAGIGVRFFELRENHAKSFGEYTHAVFCGVMREQDHPLKPQDYAPLDCFWRKRGYEKLDGVTTEFPWKDQGDQEETLKPMQFWMKEL